MTRKKATDQRVCYKIQNVVNTSDDTLLDYMLFAHTFTGCDTPSALNNFGKTTIFKLKNSNELKSTAELMILVRELFVFSSCFIHLVTIFSRSGNINMMKW